MSISCRVPTFQYITQIRQYLNELTTRGQVIDFTCPSPFHLKEYNGTVTIKRGNTVEKKFYEIRNETLFYLGWEKKLDDPLAVR